MARAQGFETIAIHAGQEPDPATGAVMTPVYLTSTYRQTGLGEHLGFEYSRTGNPTRKALQDSINALEGGSGALAFASGMAAIDAVLHLLSSGDHILAVSDLYGGSYRLLQRVYAQFGLQATYASPVEPRDFLAQVRPETRLILLESPTNPYLNLADIAALRDGIDQMDPRPWICVDNTFATPYLQRPLELGADIVVHSTTKYLGGHSDVIGGAVVVNEPTLREQLAFLQNAVGAVPGPLDCFLVLRGLKTLAVRMDRHCENAGRLARELQGRPQVARVFYPGLDEHPQHTLAQRQMRRPGGMLSLLLQGGGPAARKFVESMKIFTLAESLGGVESLVEVPAAMTHQSTAGSPLEVDAGLVRLSVGLETVDDLLWDVDQALRAVG
jgi:cystathionine gamma-lyase